MTAAALERPEFYRPDIDGIRALAIVPVVVLFALVERYLVGGLTAGSLK